MTGKRGRWVGAPDGIGHLEGKGPRTACGANASGERYSHPIRRRCIECLATEATSSLPEELLMAGYGVRRSLPIEP